MMRHLLVLPAALALDLVLGDPAWLPHPVVWIGKLIAWLEKKLRKEETDEKRLLHLGALEVAAVCLICLFLPLFILKILYRLWMPAGLILEIFWAGQLLAVKSLKQESMKVYERLAHGSLEEARKAVSMIVGRDTQALDAAGVTRAAVETVAESTSDGVTAPLFYLALGGVPLMFLYKAINTMDSMLGYKNDRYLYYGRWAAKLDDVANYLPSRLSGLLMIAAAAFCGFDGRGAARIHRRDKRNHASPNSAQTESAMAGALGLRLAGDAWYFGKLVKKPYIGDPVREIEPEDIPRANRIMVATAILSVLAGMILAAVLYVH